MKKAYSAPEADVINLQALENIAVIVDPHEARDGGSSSGGVTDSIGNGSFKPGDY